MIRARLWSLENPFYLTRGHCETCRLATLLPDDYQRQELYKLDVAEGHANATRRPPTGNPWLDDGPRRPSTNGKPPTIAEAAAVLARLLGY